jgi:hypothetical protein
MIEGDQKYSRQCPIRISSVVVDRFPPGWNFAAKLDRIAWILVVPAGLFPRRALHHSGAVSEIITRVAYRFSCRELHFPATLMQWTDELA